MKGCSMGYTNPWDELKRIAEKAKAMMPRGERQKEIDRLLREWREKGHDKEFDKRKSFDD